MLIKRITRVWLILSFLCAGQFVFADSLRIATYNLDNYLVTNRQVGSGWRPNYPKPEDEKRIIRRVIKETSPDILTLQEMGSVSFLEELRADLALDGVHYPYAVHMEAEDSSRHIALLSKVPPKHVVKHVDLSFKYFDKTQHVKRGMLEISFAGVHGREFKLFAVHLKSRLTADKADPGSVRRRTKEAEACRNRIVERTFEMEQQDFIVIGDFNDHPNSAALRRFYRRGDLAITSMFAARDSRGERWTHYYKKQAAYSTVDAILVSAALKPSMARSAGIIVDQPGVLDASDHRMVYADLNLLSTAN